MWLGKRARLGYRWANLAAVENARIVLPCKLVVNEDCWKAKPLTEVPYIPSGASASLLEKTLIGRGLDMRSVGIVRSASVKKRLERKALFTRCANEAASAG